MKEKNIIKEAREKKGISQRELARITNISNATISEIESKKIDIPNIDTLIKLCRTLELDIIDLLIYYGYTDPENYTKNRKNDQ